MAITIFIDSGVKKVQFQVLNRPHAIKIDSFRAIVKISEVWVDTTLGLNKKKSKETLKKELNKEPNKRRKN